MEHNTTYEYLEKIYPAAKIFRAGVVLFRKHPRARGGVFRGHQMLLVREKASGFYGPPKGRREPEDVSAGDTAFREIAEETGILRSQVRVRNTYFIIPRSGANTDEVFVYFVGTLKGSCRPRMDPVELDEILWTDSVLSLRTSTITRRLICALLSIDYALL